MPAITDQDGNVAQVTPEGALVVTGAGAVPAATSLRVKDGVGEALAQVDSTLRLRTHDVEIAATLIQVRDYLDTVETILANRASEVTLASVLAAVDTLEASNNAIQTVLEQRLQKNAKQFADGKYRSVGTKFTVAALGRGVIQIANPAASGKSVTITEFTLGPTSDVEIEFWMNTTVTAPVVVTPFHPNRFFAASPTVAVIERGTATTGGSQFAIVRMDSSDTPQARMFTYVIPPNESVSIQAVGLATEYTVYADITWIEETL